MTSSVLYGKPFINPVDSVNCNLLVEANAGSGKTTSLVQAIWRLLRINKDQWIKGTDEQEAFWEKFAKPAKFPSEINVLTFARKNVADFESKLGKGKVLPPSVQVSTVHKYGLRILFSARIGPSRDWINLKKGQLLLCDAMGYKSIFAIGRDWKGLPKLANRVVDLAKANEVRVEDVKTAGDAYLLITKFMREQGITAEPKVVDKFAEVFPDLLYSHLSTHTRMIDTGDMLWLPRVLGLTKDARKSPLVICDEAQDFNISQRNVVLDTADRVVVVGDTKQAIFGFQGADVKSLMKFGESLDKSRFGLTRLTLSTSFRCPKIVLPLVTPIVPSFKVLSDAPEGELKIMTWKQMITDPARLLSDKQTLFVGRRNAYLLPVAIKLIASSHACCIIGREFGEELANLLTAIVDEDTTLSCDEALPLISDWSQVEVDKATERDPNDTNTIALIADKAECLIELCRRDLNASVKTACDFIISLFQDNETDNVLLSTIHRGKGLEAENVVFLAYDAVPDPNVKQGTELHEQEWNMVYVACTRTRNKLFLVSQPDEKKAIHATKHPISIRAKQFTGTIIEAEVIRAEASTQRATVTTAATTITPMPLAMETDKLAQSRKQRAIELIRAMTDEEIETIISEVEKMQCLSQDGLD